VDLGGSAPSTHRQTEARWSVYKPTPRRSSEAHLAWLTATWAFHAYGPQICPLHVEFIRLARRFTTTKLKMSQLSTTRLVTTMPYMPTATRRDCLPLIGCMDTRTSVFGLFWRQNWPTFALPVLGQSPSSMRVAAPVPGSVDS